MNEITLINPPPGITPQDYAAIEDAVMETARGRWFLLEYARRQRAAETQRMAEAVDRLERAIETMQPQLAGAAPPAAPPLPAPTNETAAAVAERLSDIVWTMRERGVGDQFCVELEKQIRIIRTLRVEIEAGREDAALPAPVDAALAPALPAPVPERDWRRPAAGRADPPVKSATTPLQMPPPWRPHATQAEDRAQAQPAPAPRKTAPSRLENLPLMEKIALFC